MYLLPLNTVIADCCSDDIVEYWWSDPCLGGRDDGSLSCLNSAFLFHTMHIYLELWLTKMCRVTDSYHHLPPVAGPLVAPANQYHPDSDARNAASRQLFAP